MPNRRRDEFCDIHPGEALIESHPADPETGPSPDDALNQRFCLECMLELDHAELESHCLAHRTEIGLCLPCQAERFDELFKEVA